MTAQLICKIRTYQLIIRQSGKQCIRYSQDFLLKQNVKWLEKTVNALEPVVEKIKRDKLNMKLDLAEVVQFDPRPEVYARLRGEL